MINLIIFSSSMCITGQVLLLQHANKPVTRFFSSMEKVEQVIEKIITLFPFITVIISHNNNVEIRIYTKGVREEEMTLLAVHPKVFKK